jgi:uncharacterized membrane protein
MRRFLNWKGFVVAVVLAVVSAGAVFSVTGVPVLVMGKDGKFGVKATLAAAVATADTAGKTIWVMGYTPVTNDLTVPATRAIKVMFGGYIDIPSGKTLTVNGPFDGVDGCFTGAGSVAGLKTSYVTWFPVVVGTGQSSGVRATNYTAIGKSFGSCVAGGTLIFPIGTVESDLPASSPTITIATNINVIGQGGRSSSIWYIGPDGNTRSGNVMKINGGVNARFADMSIMGPTTEHAEFDTASFNNLFWFLGTSGRLDVERCTISGGWWQIFTSNSADVGTGIIDVRDSYLHANFQVGAIFGNGPTNKSFHATRCTFYSSSIWSTASGRYLGYFLYIHPGVNVKLDDCDFDTFGDGCLHHYATSYDPAWKPAYIEINKCRFKNSFATSKAALILSPNFKSTVTGCVFTDVKYGIAYRYSTDIINCRFIRTGNYAIYPDVDSVADNSVVRISQSYFENWTGTAAISVYPTTGTQMDVPATGYGFTAVLDHLTFFNNLAIPGGTFPYTIDAFSGDTTVSIDNIVVTVGYFSIAGVTKTNPAVVNIPAHGLTTGNNVSIVSITGMTQLAAWSGAITVVDADHFSLNGVDATAYSTFIAGVLKKNTATNVQGIRFRNSHGSVTNSNFNGSFTSGTILTEQSQMQTLLIDRNVFNTVTGNVDVSLYHQTAAIVEGINKYTGDVGAGYGAGTGNGSLGLQRTINPSTVSSAATTYIPTNYGTHYVSGTTQIVTLNLGRSGHVANNAFSGSEVRIIPTAAWSLGNAGNILPKNTTARAVNEVVTLLYDATAGKWVEK